jgi:hypothetical protein
MLRFSDGININTDGSLRKMHLSDGWYIVGQGMLIPMNSEQEAIDYLATQKSKLSDKAQQA